MTNKFPKITHINDVLPYIAGHDEFKVSIKDGYQSIDYKYTQSDSFDCTIRRECRGLKFDMSGNLIARPLHKFFNLGEKPAETPDFTFDHVVMDKLDGSMIHAVMLGDKLKLMTRSGISEQSEMATDHMIKNEPKIMPWLVYQIQNGYTPILEFTSPENQIVIKYPRPELTLLALRDMLTGKYVSQDVLEQMATECGLKCVQTYKNTANDLEAFVRTTKELVDLEGYVVRVGQDFVKVKADAYVMAHRAKDGLIMEKDVLAMVLMDKCDDVIPMLTENEVLELMTFKDNVNHAIQTKCLEIKDIISSTQDMVQKDFAIMVREKYGNISALLFKARLGKNPRDIVVEYGLKQTGSQTTARVFLKEYGISPWKGVGPTE